MKQSWIVGCLVIALGAMGVHGANRSGKPAGRPGEVWQPLAVTNIFKETLHERGVKVLSDPAFKWKHAQTEHFQIHYDSAMFAQKVARMAEFFYDYVGADLTGSVDRVQGKPSHIFVFKDAQAWTAFRKAHATDVDEWVFSFVHGMSMYLQQADDTGQSASVLGHEMTHLIMNRYIEGELPLWLNEGLAEWYGEFAYSAFKGTKKSKRQLFKKFDRGLPLTMLFSAQSYPNGQAGVSLFYATSRQVVGFLKLEGPPASMYPFLLDVAAGTPIEGALKTHYGYADMATFHSAFEKFCK